MSNFKFEEKGFENLESCFSHLKKTEQKSSQLDYYFDSYSYMDIHEEMLQDDIRTNAYRNAIEKNPQLFKDKVVMDIGAGSGVLSMFAVKAGAKKVYAIEKADIYKLAQKNIQENKMQDKIKIINSFVEELELEEEVDIIISEWMGYFLYFEGMFDSVLFAAKKHLKKGGFLFPDKASVSIAGVNYPDKFISKKYQNLIVPNNKSDDVKNKDFNLINKLLVINRKLGDVFNFNSKFINTEAFELKKWDLEKVETKDLDF